MKAKEFAELMTTFATAYPNAEVTFANNKVEVTKIVFDTQKQDKNEKNYSYLVVANYFSPTEIKDIQNEEGHIEKKNVRGTVTKNNTVDLKQDKKLVSYFDFEPDENGTCNFVEKPLENEIKKEITFRELYPGEFKVYKMI